MKKLLTDWYRRYFTDPDFVVLILFLLAIISGFALFGTILKPVFVSVAIAYLLSGLVDKLEKYKWPHLLSVIVVYLLFVGVFIFLLVVILPALWRQAISFFHNSPNMLTQGKSLLSHLPQRYPDLISEDQITHFTNNLQSMVLSSGNQALAYSLATISSVINIVLYFVLVPFLLFFFLMDRAPILTWFSKYLPRHRRLIAQVWTEVNGQFGSYIQGRGIQVLLLSIVNTIAFAWLGLDYAMLLGVVAALSVVIPYIGPIAATIPIFLIGLMQWGWSSHFIYLVIIYSTIFILGGYVLEPILFSERLNLHPVSIIISMLFFGGLLGFWGIFFAIPLASIVRAILNARPRV